MAELGQALPEEAIFLGMEDGVGLFAADLGRAAARRGRFAEVRTVGAWLAAREAGWFAYARALAFWHSRHRFCGACGGPTVSAQGGHIRRCQICDAQHFPRSDPAVIVLVTHRHPELGERCLLGRSARFPAGIYSTLAGFVEPGESLEETVCREIYEEAGVEIVDAALPLVAALAVPGVLDDRLSRDRQERRAAPRSRRAGRRRLVYPGRASDPERRPVQLPNRDSIARHLIEDWLYEETSARIR